MKRVNELLKDWDLDKLADITQCMHNKKWMSVKLSLIEILSLTSPNFQLDTASLEDMNSVKEKIQEALNIITKIYNMALDNFHTIWHRIIKKEILLALWLDEKDIQSITIRETPNGIVTERILEYVLKPIRERLYKDVIYREVPWMPWEKGKTTVCTNPTVKENADSKLQMIYKILENNSLTDRIFWVVSIEEAQKLWLTEDEMLLFWEIVEFDKGKKLLLINKIVESSKIESIAFSKKIGMKTDRDEFINKLTKVFYTDIIIPWKKEWRNKKWEFFSPDETSLVKLNQFLYAMIEFDKKLCEKIKVSDQYSDF